MKWWQDPANPMVQAAERDNAFARKLLNLVRRSYPNHPEWWFRARVLGYGHPCPICQATGKRAHRLHLEYPGAVFPTLACWHCAGTGDEDAAKRRNLQGHRPLR